MWQSVSGTASTCAISEQWNSFFVMKSLSSLLYQAIPKIRFTCLCCIVTCATHNTARQQHIFFLLWSYSNADQYCAGSKIKFVVVVVIYNSQWVTVHLYKVWWVICTVAITMNVTCMVPCIVTFVQKKHKKNFHYMSQADSGAQNNSGLVFRKIVSACGDVKN